MITIELNLSHLDAFLATLESGPVLQSLVVGVASSARDLWIRAAGHAFVTTRREYIAAIHEVEVDGLVASISLYDDEGSVWPYLLEEGTGGFDLKPLLLKGADHRVIPFRHSSPTSAGHAGQPIGRPYRRVMSQKELKAFSKSVYDAAKKLKTGQSLKHASTPKLKPSHSGHLYGGLTKVGGSGHSRYMTFRTVSLNSPADSWLYPAKEGAHLAQLVADALPSVLERSLEPLIRTIAESL